MLKSRYLTYQINPAATKLVSYPQMQSQTAHEKKILIDKFSPFYPVIQQFFCVLLTTSDSFFSLFREMGWKKKLVSVQLNCALQSNLENVPQCAFWCVFSSKYVPLESDSIKVTSLIIPLVTIILNYFIARSLTSSRKSVATKHTYKIFQTHLL